MRIPPPSPLESHSLSEIVDLLVSFLLDRILLSILVCLTSRKVRVWGSPSQWGTVNHREVSSQVHCKPELPFTGIDFCTVKFLQFPQRGQFFQINSCSVNIRIAVWLKNVFIYGYQKACLKQQTLQIQNKRSIISGKLYFILMILFQYKNFG